MAAVWAVVLLALLFVFLTAPARAAQGWRRPFAGRCFAHRGLHTPSGDVPENSPAAFAAALAAGYGIELDVRLSQDGKVVVFHDAQLQRVCGVPGRVEDTPWPQLRALGLCGTQQHMPLLEEVLRQVDGRVPLIVEIKEGPRREELCRALWQQLLPYSGSVCVESFDPRILLWWRRNARRVPRGQLTAGYRTLRREQGAPLSFALANCLLNCLSRPHFIAREKGQRSLGLALALAMGAMPVVWTARPGDDTAALQAANQAVIFEWYAPRIRY